MTAFDDRKTAAEATSTKHSLWTVGGIAKELASPTQRPNAPSTG